MSQSIVSRGTFGMTFLCYVAWQGLRCVASGIWGLTVEDPPVLHSGQNKRTIGRPKVNE